MAMKTKHKEVRQKIVETMKINKQVYQAYAENFDSHLENMMRSDGHSNTWATEAEILATSEAYKCDVFVLKEQDKSSHLITTVTITKSRSRY